MAKKEAEMKVEDQKKLFQGDREISKITSGEWPKYAMASWSPEEDRKKKKRKFYTFAEAAQLYDSGFVHVEFGIYVLYQDGSMRRMTDYDQVQISNAAEEYSASK